MLIIPQYFRDKKITTVQHRHLLVITQNENDQQMYKITSIYMLVYIVACNSQIVVLWVAGKIEWANNDLSLDTGLLLHYEAPTN